MSGPGGLARLACLHLQMSERARVTVVPQRSTVDFKTARARPRTGLSGMAATSAPGAEREDMINHITRAIEPQTAHCPRFLKKQHRQSRTVCCGANYLKGLTVPDRRLQADGCECC
jgi:hypothetical protein